MFKRIYIFFFTYMAAMYFSQTLLVFWLSKNGFGFSSLVIYYLLSFLVALIGIFILPKKKMSSKKTIFWGIVFSILSVFVLIRIFSSIQLYISAIISGLNVIYFWIPYNIMYFKYGSDSKIGTNSGAYYLITPIIGITLQPLTGIVAEKFGFEIMFLVGMVLYILPFIILKFLPNFEWDLDIKKEIFSLKPNWSTLLQGISSKINFTIIPIFTLFFITTPRQFGNFFGYLALITAIASLINGYFSDKIKSRKYFFYLFSIIAVLSFLPLAFAKNTYSWVILVGISSLCIYLANPFWLAFNIDYYKNLGIEKSIILREVFLNAGYTLNFLIVFSVFYFTNSTKISLFVISIICCLLPIVSYFQGVYRNKNNV
jgi:hypothetical protein